METMRGCYELQKLSTMKERYTSDWTVESMLSELEQSVLEHRNKRGKAITLDFSGVVFIDDAGVRLLRKMKHKKLKIVNCSLFIKTLIGDLIEEAS